MKNTLSLVLAIIGLGPAAHADFHCDSVLKDGIFAQEDLRNDVNYQYNYRLWQCASEFSNKEDAKRAGHHGDMELYGISGDFNYSKEQRESWKKDNCSEEEKSIAFTQVFRHFKKSAADGVLAAWQACNNNQLELERLRNDKKELACRLVSFERKYVTFGIRYTGSTSNIPAVSDSLVRGAGGVGARGRQDAVNPVKKITPEEKLYTFARHLDEDGAADEVVLTVNTTDGPCEVKLDASPEEHNRVLTISNKADGTPYVVKADLRRTGRKIVIKDDTVIRIENGATLTLEGHVIEFGENVTVEAPGNPGAPGRAGEDNANNPRLVYSDEEMRSWLDRCAAEPDARGGAGQKGANGSPGGKLLLVTNKLIGAPASVYAPGGEGGAGGPGGRPQRIRQYYSGELRYCPAPAPAGASGEKGADGGVLPRVDLKEL